MAKKATRKPEQLPLSSRKLIPLDKLTINKDLQVRGSVSESLAKEYAFWLSEDTDLDPAKALSTVDTDGKELILLCDGFHRHRAYQMAKRDKMPVTIEEGGGDYEADLKRALEIALCNTRHGERMSRSQKIHAVQLAIARFPRKDWSDRKIALSCGVSPQLVANVRSGKATEKPRLRKKPEKKSRAVREQEPKRSKIQEFEDRTKLMTEWVRQGYMDLISIANTVEDKQSRLIVVRKKGQAITLVKDGVEIHYTAHFETKDGKVKITLGDKQDAGTGEPDKAA